MSDYLYIEGELAWVRTEKPETDPWGNTKWKVTVFPNAASMPVVMDLLTKGIKNSLKRDENNRYYITFSRPESTKNGTKFDKPKVIDANGNTINGLIGNGSTGIVKVEVRNFTTKQGAKGTTARFDSIKVDKLVPYGDDASVTETSSSSEGF